MKTKNASIIKPTPTIELLEKEEKLWKIKLPDSYKKFIFENNGCTLSENTVECNNHNYTIDRFLCILEDTETHEFGMYDIDVITTQLEERLTDNEDLVGVELLPIAQLFAGDYLCLDYKSNKTNPEVYC